MEKQQQQASQDFMWETVEDGYHRKIIIVQASTGLIIGTVGGSSYEPKEGWYALYCPYGEQVHLGRYLTEEQAKTALFKHLTDHLDKEFD